MRTVYSILPYASYAKFLRAEKFTIAIPQVVENLQEDVPTDFPSSVPEIVCFDNRYFIGGTNFDVLAGSRFLLNHPNISVMANYYENLQDVEDNFVATYGYEIDQYEDINSDLAPKYEDFDYIPEPKSRSKRLISESMETQFSNIDIMIQNDIVNYTPSVNKTSLLVGHTGISKSSIVEGAIQALDSDGNGFGYRMVDLKAGFLDNADLLGFAELETYNGEQVWSDSPKKELLTCSTPFVMTCRGFLKTVTEDADPDIIAKIKYYAKTPVLFLDEINRAPAAIINQLMTIINQHKLNNYDLSIAPIICAANLAIDLTDKDNNDLLTPAQKELITYNVFETNDKAIRDRFIPIMVHHKDRTVLSHTYRFLSDKYENSKLALALLDDAKSSNPGYLYDVEKIDEYGKFPTFRGHDDLCAYLGWCEKSKTNPLSNVVSGLVGKNITPTIMRALAKPLATMGLKFDEDPSTDAFVDHLTRAEYSYTSGSGESRLHKVPILLLGRMGIAKTAKLNAAANRCGNLNGKNCSIKFEGTDYCSKVAKYNYSTCGGYKPNSTLVRIDLSAQSRTTISGLPTPSSFVQSLFDDKSKSSNTFKEFEAVAMANPQIPKKTTIFVENVDIKRAIDEAKAIGAPITLMFDEINRCSNIVQSAVFEAISNRRFLGVDLSDVKFSVVAAGNWNNDPFLSEQFETSKIDTATMHRFAGQFITKLTKEDFDSWLQYLKVTYPLAYKIAMATPNLIDLLNADDDGDDDPATAMARPTLSFRTFQAIEETILNNKYSIVPNGATPAVAAKILRLDDYILRKLNGPRDIIIFDFANIAKIYGAKKMSSPEYLEKTIQLLEDPNTSPTDAAVILNFLSDDPEDQRAGVIFTKLDGIIPENCTALYGPIKELLESQGLAQIAAIAAQFNLFSSDIKEVDSAIADMLAKVPPALATSDYVISCIKSKLDADGKASTDDVLRVIDRYQSGLFSTGRKIDFATLDMEFDGYSAILAKGPNSIDINKTIYNTDFDLTNPPSTFKTLSDQAITTGFGMPGLSYYSVPIPRSLITFDVYNKHYNFRRLKQQAGNSPGYATDIALAIIDNETTVKSSGTTNGFTNVSYHYRGLLLSATYTASVSTINEPNFDKVFAPTINVDTSLIEGLVSIANVNGGKLADIPSDVVDFKALEALPEASTSNQFEDDMEVSIMGLISKSAKLIDTIFSI